MSILYWNCRGYTSNFEELKILALNQNPDAICLQETFHGNRTPYPPSGYEILSANPIVEYLPGRRPPRGVLTLIKNTTPYYTLDLRTPLEAIAIRIHNTTSLTICNIYISPIENLLERDLLQLIEQLPSPFILVGDFNAHSRVWGSPNTNDRGLVVENILQNTDACLLNQGEATHEHLQTGSSTCIDLCLLSSTILSDYEWCRMNDLCGSDHYPIMVRPIAMNGNEAQKRLLIDKADWKLFHLLADGNYDQMKMHAVDDMV